MTKLRAFSILLVFVTVTVIFPLPLQWAAVKLHFPARRSIPYRYHRFVCRLFGVRVSVLGAPIRGGGLMTANHTGWLDIPILSAVAPVSFVAKMEVAQWPFFGTLARLQRTIFIRRERGKALEDRDTIRKRLLEGDALVLFPEGTSSDGNRVLPFLQRSSCRRTRNSTSGRTPRITNATPACNRFRLRWSGCMACPWAGKTAPSMLGTATWSWCRIFGRRSNRALWTSLSSSISR